MYEAFKHAGSARNTPWMSPSAETDCSQEARQTQALVSGMDRFVHGRYLIDRDSVRLNLVVIQTRFIDRQRNEFVVQSPVSALDSMIYNALEFVFAETATEAPANKWQVWTRMIIEDAGKYTQTGLTASLASKAYIGIAAYKTGNYKDAELFLSGLNREDPLYGEAMYVMAKLMIGNNNYNKAMYFVREALSVGYRESLMQEYLTHCGLLNRPADWYDTEAKRLEWWNNLSGEEVSLMIQLMDNLGINGRKFTEAYVYRDEDIRQLFQTTVLSLKNMKPDDLRVFSCFTRVDLLLLENTRMKSDDGVQYLTSLKVVRTDEKLKTDQLKAMMLSNKIAVLLKQP